MWRVEFSWRAYNIEWKLNFCTVSKNFCLLKGLVLVKRTSIYVGHYPSSSVKKKLEDHVQHIYTCRANLDKSLSKQEIPTNHTKSKFPFNTSSSPRRI